MTQILVCDDDREIVDAIEIYLSQEGYKIFKAYDGEQALDILGSNDIQLLIMDVMMPKLDGIHATLKIREYSSISPACWELGFQAWAQSTCPELSAQGACHSPTIKRGICFRICIFPWNLGIGSGSRGGTDAGRARFLGSSWENWITKA